MKAIYKKEAILITFWECVSTENGDEMQFKKRMYKDEEKAREFLEKLVNSDRKLTNIQMKVNYQVSKL